MDALTDAILEETGTLQSPYFEALRDGSFQRDDFVETQIQFAFVVDFFSRPMAAIAAKVPSSERRLSILRNVWEEHGEGNLAIAHGATFREFLRRIGGVSPESLESKALWPEARLFNTGLAGAAVLDETLVSIGMLGMIERMFVDLSAAIGQAVVARGWLDAADMIHYDLHEELDVRHAGEFFDLLRQSWSDDEASRYYIEQGLRLGAAAFDGLYRGLYRARGRRWSSVAHVGPHART